MGNRKIIENYFVDINNLVDILSKLVNSYRLLIGGAGELNSIALAKKSEVKDALHRVDKVGDIIDDIIKVIDESGYSYTDYCKLKAQFIGTQLQAGYIETEIGEELIFKNDKN